MQLHLTKVGRYTTDKEGKALVTSDGRPYTRLLIRTQEYGDKVISGFGASWNESWKDGQTVEAEVKPTADGKYLNLVKPDPIADLCKLYNKLERRVWALEEKTTIINDDNQTTVTINDKDLPF